MKTKLLIMMTLASLLASCKHTENSFISIVNDSICSTFQASPDQSICIEDLKAHMTTHPQRWQTAFKFLSEMDVNNLPFGRTDLSEDVYVNISNYQTKEFAQCSSESHKQYIDIQYIAKGREYMGFTRNTNLPIVKEYDSIADYMLYDFQPTQLQLATPDVYFIFFPADIHCPCIQVSQPEDVTKIVIKIKY